MLKRKRLLSFLDKSRKRPVTWISAPGGSGKTTLVTSYLDNRKLPCLWYTVDAGDTDIASFFYYMGLAIKKAAPRYLKPMPLLTPEYLLGIPAFTQRYFEEFYRRVKPPFVIVLDDYQLVPPESPFHEVVNTGFALAPSEINIIVISRNEPPPAFILLRANDKISLLGWKEIRLTQEETKDFVRQKEERQLTDKTLSLLYKKTEGWIAGLVLLIESSKIKGMDYQSLDRDTPMEIFEYFAREIFLEADREVQDFLLKTSFLPAMMAQTAQALTGIHTSAKILQGLDKNNYFIERHLKENPIYSYHPLFREFLMSRAKEAFAPDETARIQRSAAALIMELGQVEEAAVLLIDARDWKGFIPFVLNYASVLMAQGRIETLREWLAAVPTEIKENTPWLLYWLGASKLVLNPAESRTYFEKAFRLFESQKNDGGTFLAWSGVVQTFLFEFDGFQPLDKWINWLDEQARRGMVYPSPEIAVNVASGMTGALAWRMPFHPDAKRWADSAVQLSQENLNIDTRLRACTNSAIYYLWMGEYAECGILLDEMRKMVQSQPASPPREIILKIVEAMFHNASAEFQGQANQAVSEGLEIAQKSGVHVMDVLLYLQGAISALNAGDQNKVHEFLLKMERAIGTNRHAHSGHYFYLLSWYYFLVKHIPQALATAKEALRLIQEAGLPVSETLVRVVLSHALYESGEIEEAQRQLHEATRIAAQTGSSYCTYFCSLTEAYFSLQRNYEEGRRALRNALTLGRQKGYVSLLYLWSPDMMSYLCMEGLEAGIELEYVRELIGNLHLDPPFFSDHLKAEEPRLGILNENWPWPVKIYTLGRFTLMVNGNAQTSAGKAQKRPVLLLKALIAMGAKEIREEQLADILWPEAEGDAGHNAMKTNIARLRQMLGDDRAVHVHEGRISLDNRYCWVDSWSFERLCGRALQMMENVTNAAGEIFTLRQIASRALGLYHGPFLNSETDQNWTLIARERLRSKYLRLILGMAKISDRTNNSEEAVQYHLKGLETEPLSEEFHQGLIASYIRLGRHAEALAAYKRCEAILHVEFGIKPSPRTQALRAEILKK